MSNAYAIAAVTAALKNTLQHAIEKTVDSLEGKDPTVSALPPDRVNPAGGVDPNRLNLFLYSVSVNQGWRNEHQPVRNSAGMRVDSQPLALDLHYLLSAFGASDYGAEILLGHGMQALQEVPFFTRSWLTNTLKSGAPPNDIPVALETTGLPEQIEQIRITPTTLSLDDMSRIWSAIQSKYRLSATYLVTVVLIESRQPIRAAMPVLKRNIVVSPWSAINIDAAVNAAGDREPITAGTTLRLRGTGLGSLNALVKVMDVDFTSSVTRRAETELDVALANPLPPGVRAGIIPVQLVQPIVGTTEFSSNAAAVLLRPLITATKVAAGKLTVTLIPNVSARQRVLLLLNERQPAAQPGKAFSVNAPLNNGIAEDTTDTNKIEFSLEGITKGTYVVRVQVDGAESPVQLDAGGKFSDPNVIVP